VQYQVPIVEVIDTFTQQKKTGHPSTKQHTVAYAVVKIEFEGSEYTVTVFDDIGDLSKPEYLIRIVEDAFSREKTSR